MTKVEAVKKVLENLEGVATWEQIYREVEKFYPRIKTPKDWKEALRGVVYREIYAGRTFKKVGLGIIALLDYEDVQPSLDKEKDIQSFIEGALLEIGNFEGYLTYTPDTRKIFKGNVILANIATLSRIPEFTYPDIVERVRRIDVLWFNKGDFRFPRAAFEVIHTPSTLTEALNRCLNLMDFKLALPLTIIGLGQNRDLFIQKLNARPYSEFRDSFAFKDYESVINYYEGLVKTESSRKEFFIKENL